MSRSPGVWLAHGLVLATCYLLSGCPGGMVVEVQIEHRLRCTLVKQHGLLRVSERESTLTLEECKQALERILAEWERLK